MDSLGEQFEPHIKSVYTDLGGTKRVDVEPYRTKNVQGHEVEITGFYHNGGDNIGAFGHKVKKDGTTHARGSSDLSVRKHANVRKALLENGGN